MARSDAKSAGKASLRLQGADQRMQRAPSFTGVLQAHRAAQRNLRQGGRRVEKTRFTGRSADRAGFRGRKESCLPRGRWFRARQTARGKRRELVLALTVTIRNDGYRDCIS